MRFAEDKWLTASQLFNCFKIPQPAHSALLIPGFAHCAPNQFSYTKPIAISLISTNIKNKPSMQAMCKAYESSLPSEPFILQNQLSARRKNKISF